LNYDCCVLANTGVEADEIAVKIAFKWAYNKKFVEPNKAKIILAWDNFWGRTIAASGSSNDPDRYFNYGPYGFNCTLIDYNNSEQLENILKLDPNIAAFMIEPI